MECEIPDDDSDLLGPAPVAASGALPATVSPATLASLVGITPNRLNKLARDGVIPRLPDKRLALPDAVVAYVAYCKANPEGRRIANPDLAEQKLRLAREQTDKIALQNARARGDLLDANVVRAEWLSVAADLRARLLAVPSRVAARVGLDRTATAALDGEIRRAMEDIANSDG